MLVASHIESGDQAVAAVLPPIIGTIHTAIGCATLRRADLAIQVLVGDPVRQGDVIETAADGQVGIRLIDGTLFMLSRGTRVVLDEFVCDPDGASHSALLAVTKGSFAFIAGRMARNGSLRIDTPLGSIRGRAHAGGFGTLSLAALTFASMSDVQAADPNATFWDDDSITYKDLEHGTFELWTKEAIPRHIIVEDPAETVVISRIGSSVSVNQVANSAARMEELQAAQQAVLANFAKGYGPNGSSTPYYFNQQLLQPINFTQPDSLTKPNQLSPLESAPNPIFYPLIPPPPPPVPPTLNTATGPTLVDTIVFDTFTASVGKFVATSSNGPLSFSIAGGTTGATVFDGVTYDVSQTGQYGTLYLDSTTGAFIYVPNNNAVNALKAPTTQTFTITVSDGTLSASQVFTITIDGANDAAFISGTTSGAVVEAGAVANAVPGTPTATGTLTDTDVDDPANTFTAINSPTTSDKGYGTYTMTAAGVWTYTLNNTNPAVQGLNANSTPLTDTFTVTTVDGTPQQVTVTITGSNDAAVISGKTTGSVIEAGGVANATPGAPTATGILTDADVDNAANTFIAVGSTLSDNGYGHFTMTAAGVWTYTLDNNNSAVQGLNANTPPLTDSFTVTTVDGTSQQIKITITGSNDAAVISGTKAGSVIEAGDVVNATPGLQTTTGTLTDTDVDNLANTFIAVTSPTKSTGGYGSFTMTAAGVWTYTLDEANGAVQALNVGDTLIDTFTVTSIDGTPQVVTITIQGPMIAVTGTAPALTLSEAHLTATAFDDNIAGSAPNATGTTTSANFSTAFDGVDGATISFALSITGGDGTASGLIDSHTGLADVLVLNGNTIEGHVGTINGTLAFTITIDPNTGLVTFTEYRAVTQPFGTSPDGGEGVSLTAGIVNLKATVTDADGNFQTVSRDLGSRLTITDDGPMIAAGTAPALTLSEAHLTAGSAPSTTGTTTSGNFSTAFTSVRGADGATISYALSITGGNGAASGLIDSQTGEADVLVLNGNTIEGHVGTTAGALAFTITVDPNTGVVKFTEYRAVSQALATNPDTGEGASLTAGIVNLIATITDKDGDFQIASIDLGRQLTITDDGPTIGSFDHTSIEAKDGASVIGHFVVNFGADGDAAMLVAVHNGAVGTTGYNLATASVGSGITSVHVTGNGDDYTFYYTTHAVNGGVELDAFFTNSNGTLSDPFFTLLINPDKSYTFDIVGVGFLQQTTVSGSDFGASSSGQSSLTSPDDLLVITGDFNGAPAHVKASNNGIAVGDTGLQMDQHETLLLTFKPEQTDVSFNLTQWQGNGTADVVFKVFDGTTDIHDFSISIPKPSGDAHIVVEKTSNPTLVNTSAFDSATSTYTLYVGSEFNQIQVSYDQAVAGNTTFTVNNITYAAGTRIPSTDLLFDVTAVDSDGDTSTTSLQVDLLGVTSVASALTLSSTPLLATTTVNSTNDAAISSGDATSSAIMASGTGNDTIIGGFGADTLSGGNGDDTFVHLSVADSNSTQFDIIADFQSGSDKINLVAFGALTFMALSPTATTVPPHTLAWIYDSASNQTIVYVNPTDQTLDIGDSSLVEIHLEGVTSVAESDFVVYEPPTAAVVAAAAADAGIDPALLVTTASDGTVLTSATADASVDATVSESARVTDVGWTMPADESFGFHFAPDRIDTVGSVRLASFGEARAYVTEDNHGDAVTTLASVSSIEHPHAHTTVLMEDHFTFDHEPIHAKASATVTGDVAVTSTSVTVDHALSVATATAELQLAEHDAAPGNSGGHSQSQHASHSAAADASPSVEVQVAEHDATPGNSAGHSQSQHASHSAAEDASASAEVQVAEHDAAPGNSAGHSQSQHASHSAAEDASASAEVQVAEQDAAPGNSAGHSQSQHASHSAGGDASASAEVQVDEHDAAPGNSAGHSQSQHASHSASESASSDPPTQTEMAAATALGDSFHFNDEIAGAQHSAAVEVADADHGHASEAHEAAAAIVEVQAADLSPTEQYPADQASAGHQHAASHAAHDLIV
jgi:VCBS repeat-containing protein